MSSSETVQVGSLILTHEEAERAGLLPEQCRERARQSLAILQRHGQEDTQFGRALRRVAVT